MQLSAAQTFSRERRGSSLHVEFVTDESCARESGRHNRARASIDRDRGSPLTCRPYYNAHRFSQSRSQRE
jgi:hypothetical protein